MSATDFGDDFILRVIAGDSAMTAAQRERLNDMGRIAWEWRGIDQEIGELVEDSLTTANLRDFGTGERVLVWRWSNELSMELLVADLEQRSEVTGFVDSTEEVTRVVLTSILGDRQLDEDVSVDGGTFRFVSMPGRLSILRLTFTSRTVTSGWIRL